MWAGGGGVLLLGLDPAGEGESEDGTEERVRPVGEGVVPGEEEFVIQVAGGSSRGSAR